MAELGNTIQLSGFDFPAVRQTPFGPLSFVTQDTVTLILASIKQILLTNPGERPWNPAFGCPLKGLIFENPTATQLETIHSLVYNALKTWEPRIDLDPEDVEVSRTPNVATVVTILVSFRIKSANSSAQAQQSLRLSLSA